MNFSLEQLRAFVAVYEQRSFSKAAVKLDKHRTTIGQVITNLEDQVAVELFNRVGRSVEATEDGELLYRYAKTTVQQALTFDKVALSLSFGGLESITIAYGSFMSPGLLTDIRLKLLEEFPNMKVHYVVRTKPEIKKGIEDGSIHLAIVNVYNSKVVNSIDFTFLKNLDFYLYTGKDHPLATAPKNKTMSMMKSSKQLVLKAMLDDDMAQKVILSSDHEIIDQMTLILKLLEANVGWALLPSLVTISPSYQEKVVTFKSEQLLDHVSVPIALWAPYSKQIAPIKEIVSNIFAEYPYPKGLD
ncbi:LysR family transcriptional regulator [Shewanella sp. 10N.286.51.B7]|uniref:LysR family transcriptional regulator n=1 Tax=Shewanella sp. 10N.286.51.B7 TaxID=1880836 RepID=UPI000C824BA4|nr:LysR family transcriptional regulator [Shewanella sp. 10N.286.51.B7]PMG73503.1 LysR family transcriptional regulator [Shewanella sp. 10N.286.51.B7]